MDKLMEMTLVELKEAAKEIGLKGVSRKNKKELAMALLDAGYKPVSEQVTLELVDDTDLTDKEKQVVLAMSQDDFYDGEGSILWLEIFVSGAATEELSEKAIGGIITSLQNKGVVTVQVNEPKIESTIALTKNGEKILNKLLLDKETSTVPTNATPTRAILKTFTGMLIGKVKEDGTPFTYELVEQDGLYRLTKLDGNVLEFDKATLKQVNAKNPKFANKIELV